MPLIRPNIKHIFKNKKQKKGFTLIELLVVVSIISLLSSIVMSSVAKAREKAKYARAQAEMTQFINSAVLAQQEKGRLQNITGSNCSDCSCRGRDIRNIVTSDSCYVQWLNVLTTIQNSTNGAVTNLTQMTRDPWGSPYGLDENEKESGSADCRPDTIRTVGPDGIYGTADDYSANLYPSSLCP